MCMRRRNLSAAGGGVHGPQVILSFGAAEGGADEFAVGEDDAVFVDGLLEAFDVVGADLMAEAA